VSALEGRGARGDTERLDVVWLPKERADP